LISFVAGGESAHLKTLASSTGRVLVVVLDVPEGGSESDDMDCPSAVTTFPSIPSILSVFDSSATVLDVEELAHDFWLTTMRFFDFL